MTSPFLRMDSVSKSFGPTRALRQVSLEARAGEALALIGENGAGKSTLMKILSGAIRPDSGILTVDGKSYAPQGPSDARRAGVAMIYQELNLAPDLSVEDNILLGQEIHRGGLIRRQAQHQIAREALARLGHADLPLAARVCDLSPGLKQLVEIARALASRARLIVFDEPTSSLTQQDAERLFEVIHKLRKDGIAIIYISHFLEEVRAVCQRYAVLRDGQSAGSGELAGTSERQIVNLMVGRNVDELFPHTPHQPGAVLLGVRSLSGRRLPRSVKFDLRRGEILGLFGLVGSGRTETLRCLFGLDAATGGICELAGQALSGGPRARIQRGLALVSEDRKGEGLAQDQSLVDNVTYSRLKPYRWCGWLNLARRRRTAEDLLRRLQVKAASPESLVSSLSGGNQQKVALARVLHQQAEVLLLDEPTRGIDIGTKAEIYRLMGELASQGKAILFVSSYLPELLATCDRVAVMARGELRDVRPASEWTEASALAAAMNLREEQ
jgi:ribose transport system ATP-binding protein